MATKLRFLLLLALLGGCAAPQPGTVRRLPDAAATVEDGPADSSSELSMVALSQLGIAYANGGNSPEEGFDCSGLVNYVYREATGLRLPRTTYALQKLGKAIEPEELKPGDLVFFNTLSRAYSHVGIYLGGQRFIHAPSTGGVVRIESMGADYWMQRYNGARRLTAS